MTTFDAALRSLVAASLVIAALAVSSAARAESGSVPPESLGAAGIEHSTGPACTGAASGVRFSFAKRVFVTADVSHMFALPVKGEGLNGGLAYRPNGSVTITGKFDQEQDANIAAVMFGGGFRF